MALHHQRTTALVALLSLPALSGCAVRTAADPAQWVTVQSVPGAVLQLPRGAAVQIEGRLEHGDSLDIAWASSSRMACWPAASQPYFDGRHVLLTAQLPRHSTMTIELEPQDPQLDLSLYAYSVGTPGEPPLPPAVEWAVACEESHLFGVTSAAQKSNPGSVERVSLSATSDPYAVVIGVAGAYQASAGPFRVRIETSRDSVVR